jgi:hypothetical protein
MGLQDNKSPWAQGAAFDTNRTPSLDEIVDRKFATHYLTQRLPLPYGDLHQFRDRIGKKIDTACGNGRLQSINGKFQFGDLAAWADSREDLAAAVADVVIPVSGSAQVVLPTFTVRAHGYSIPTSLTECQTALESAYRELSNFQEENKTLREALTELTPFQDRALARSKAASLAGKKGGRPKKN